MTGADAAAAGLVAAEGVSAGTVDLLARAFATHGDGAAGSLGARRILLVQHGDWQGERALAERFGVELADHVRIGFDGDRLWIGPHFSPAAPGCSTCFAARLRNNHPQRDDWPQLFGGAEPGRAGEFPLTPALAAVVAALAGQVAAEDGPGALPYYVFECGRGRIENHRFFADPECPRCGRLPLDAPEAGTLAFRSRPKADPRQYRLPNPALSRRTVEEAFVDRRSGMVKHVFQDMNSSLMPMAAAEAVMFKAERPTIGYGRAPTVEQSRMVAVLEAAERFASTRPRGRRTAVRATRAELGDAAVDPRLFTLHAPEQQDEPGYQLVPYSDDLEQGWSWAWSWRRRGPVLIPEQIAYYGLADAPGRPVNRFVHDTSSGCSLGGSLEEATLYGLFELIERDAYLTGWYGEFPYPPLDCSGARDPAIAGLIARSRAEGYGIHLFDMTLEFGVPSIFAMIEDPREGAPVRSYCAAAANLDPEKAIVSALVEVISSMAVYRNSMPASRDHARDLLADPSLVQTMEDHVLLFSQPETMAWLDFLPRFAPPVPLAERFAGWYAEAPPADLLDELEALVGKVLAVAEDVIVVDQGFSALEPLSLSAVRVVAPGLSPVTFGQQYRRIALERIRKAGRFLGIDRELTAATINLKPHNFP